MKSNSSLSNELPYLHVEGAGHVTLAVWITFSLIRRIYTESPKNVFRELDLSALQQKIGNTCRVRVKEELYFLSNECGLITLDVLAYELYA